MKKNILELLDDSQKNRSNGTEDPKCTFKIKISKSFSSKISFLFKTLLKCNFKYSHKKIRNRGEIIEFRQILSAYLGEINCKLRRIKKSFDNFEDCGWPILVMLNGQYSSHSYFTIQDLSNQFAYTTQWPSKLIDFFPYHHPAWLAKVVSFLQLLDIDIIAK